MDECRIVNIVKRKISVTFLFNSPTTVGMDFHFNLNEIRYSDEVDRIILDKPHRYHDQPIDVMKYIKSNIDLMNIKYESRQRSMRNSPKSIDYSSQPAKSSDRDFRREPLNDEDLMKEVFHLQDTLTQLSRDFEFQRRQLDDDCAQQLKKNKENVDQTRQLQNDLQQGKQKSIPEQSSSHLFRIRKTID